MTIIRKSCAAENFRRGRQGYQVEAIVIHIIDGSQAGCDATFASNSLGLRRSAHYSVGRNGEIHQYIDESDTAFHAGRIQQPTWTRMKKLLDGSYVNPNLYTIGIEHEGRAHDDWPDEMYQATANLMAAIASRHPGIGAFSAENVVLHGEIFSGKSCPGFKFERAKLLSRIPKATPAPVVAAVAPAAAAVAPTVVTVERPLRVRSNSPRIASPVKTVLPIGRQVTPVGLASGDDVDGNARWYELPGNEFIWAGGTDHP